MSVTYYKVVMTESERGWGQRTDDVLYFRDREEAAKYATDYNTKHNNKETVPDWYIRADGPYTETINEKLLEMIKEDILKEHARKVRRKGRKARAGVLVG